MNLAGTRMNRVGKGDSVKRGVGRLWSTDANEQRKRQRNQSYGYNIKYYNIHLYVLLYIYYLFYVLYNNESRTTCNWSWNYTHFQLYDNIILLIFYACEL